MTSFLSMGSELGEIIAAVRQSDLDELVVRQIGAATWFSLFRQQGRVVHDLVSLVDVADRSGSGAIGRLERLLASSVRFAGSRIVVDRRRAGRVGRVLRRLMVAPLAGETSPGGRQGAARAGRSGAWRAGSMPTGGASVAPRGGTQDLVELAPARDPGVLFAFRILLPSLVHFGEWPSRLFRRARQGDVEALARLLRLEPRLIEEPRVSAAYRAVMRAGRAHHVSQLNAALVEGLPPLDRRRAKITLAAIAAITARRLDKGLASAFTRANEETWPPMDPPELFRVPDPTTPSFPDLYRLLGAIAADRAGETDRPMSVVDPDVPPSPEAFKKAVQRRMEELKGLWPPEPGPPEPDGPAAKVAARTAAGRDARKPSARPARAAAADSVAKESDQGAPVRGGAPRSAVSRTRRKPSEGKAPHGTKPGRRRPGQE